MTFGDITLLNCDCMAHMATVPDKFYELAIVDPPFGVGNFVQKTGNIRGKSVNWNNHTPSKAYFKELGRISKHRIIFGANYYNCFEGKNGAVIWIKNQPMPDFSKAVIASCSMHQKIELYEQAWTNFVADGRTGIHPCEMPVALYKWLLKNYAKEGDKILDTHGGSMSIAIACADYGFKLDLCELDKDYYDDGVKRFKNHIAQQKLFV